MKDRIGNDISVGDFIVYVTKTESPSLQFGWVDELKDKENHYGQKTLRVKVAHSEPDGTRKTKVVFQYDHLEGKYANYDTGRPSTAWLESHGESDDRFMVTQPI